MTKENKKEFYNSKNDFIAYEFPPVDLLEDYGEEKSNDKSKIVTLKEIIISDNFTKYEKTNKSHKVIDIEYEYTLFVSVGVVAICEVDPPFESEEKIVVWLESPFEQTYGYAELTVP